MIRTSTADPSIETPVPAVAGRWGIYAAAYVALAVAYWATMPANRFESWDGYFFAHQVETYGLAEVQDTRLLLFHAVMRSLYVALNALGVDASAHEVMLAVGVLAAPAALLLLHRFLAVTLSVSPGAALLAAGFLGASYGFWRYAGEAEGYIPSMMLIMASLTAVFAADRSARAAGRTPLLIGPGLLAGLTVLFYQPNAIPLFLALPIVFLRRDRLRPLLSYGASGALVIVGGYVLAFLVSQDAPLTVGGLIAFVNERSAEFGVEPISYRILVDSFLALAHDTASTNWIFGHAPLIALAERFMPGRVIDAEIYTAAKSGVLASVPLITLPVLAAAGLWSAAVAWRKRRLIRPLDRLSWFGLAWLALYALVVGRLDANSFEPWIMALLPLAVVLGVFVFDPGARAGRAAAPAVLVAALLVHNAAAMGSLQSAAGDQHRAKNEWLIANTTPADLVVVPLRDFQFEAFILYNVPADFISIERSGLAAVRRRIAAVAAAGGRVFAHDDLFGDLRILAVRDPGLAAATRSWAAAVAPRRRLVFENDAGQVYRIAPAAANSS